MARDFAAALLKELPHVDKRVALLSDLAGEAIPDGTPAVWAPLEAARKRVENCGIVNAVSWGRRVTVSVACTSSGAARGRTLSLVVSTGRGAAPTGDAARSTAIDRKDALATAELLNKSGEQSVALSLDTAVSDVEARLSESDSDAIGEDDTAPVAPHAGALTVAVVADPTTGSVETGGPTLVEQALAALEADATVRPLTVTPNEPAGFAPHAALILDDPPGLTSGTKGAHAFTVVISPSGVRARVVASGPICVLPRTIPPARRIRETLVASDSGMKSAYM